jgi:cysteinyl-tRNA synthetase
MTLHVYNTMSRSLEPLTARRPGVIDMFVCGPTVYDYSHLGHAKTYTQFDVIARYLRFRGYALNYLQNITDVDDKIIRRAAARGVSPGRLAEEYEQYYLDDMAALHNTNVTVYARAHDYIPQIVDQIQRLLDKGFAYRIEDGYYYDVHRFPSYGKLSGRTKVNADDAVSRIDENVGKRSPADFCLWKFRKAGEPYWSTPLGEGRPGWHIEDTAITEHHFGPQYDIHGGASDLIFPHHEAEIAQMEAASGQTPLVRHWLHTGFLNTRSEKMSKSQGNSHTIRDALRQMHYTVLRFLFLSYHYRQSIELSEDVIEHARKGLQRIHVFNSTVDPELDNTENERLVRDFRTRFVKSLDQDFDTPGALIALFDFIREQNRRGGADRRVRALLDEVNEVFDILPADPDVLDAEIERHIALRQQLRAQKRFADADAIRDQLAGRGIVLEDTGATVKWRRRR